MNRQFCPGILHEQIGFEMIGEIMGPGDRDLPGYNKVELDKDIRAGPPRPEAVEPVSTRPHVRR